jgi:Uma2 family endonuclease
VSSTAPRRTPPPSVEDYLRAEEASPIKHEYVAGQIYAFAGATEDHNRIAMNIAALLWNAAGDGPCRVVGSDMRLRIGEDAVYYPDVQVVCDPTDTEPMYKTSPCVVVEVLSPSTQSIDLREKLIAYRRIESLRAYVIVYRDEIRVLRHFRDDDGARWDAEVIGHGSIPFPCPDVELTLAEIYRGVAPAPRGASPNE